MADNSHGRFSPSVKDRNNETTLYRDNRPLLKVECGITLGLLKLIYSSDASYDGTLLGVKPRLSTESVPCVVTFDSTQLTYSEYDLIVQAVPAAVHLQKVVSRDEQISAGPQKSVISRERDIACYNRNYPEELSHSLAHSAGAQTQHEEISEKCITPGSSSSNNQMDASQDVQLSLRSICISAIQSAGSNVAQFTHGHHLPSQQVLSSSENLTYMDCDTDELPDSTVQEFEVEVLDVSTGTDKTTEIDEQDFEAPERIQFNPEEFKFDIGSVIPFQSDKGTRWPCDRCGKDFCTSSHLKRHWILHTDFKPYKCKVCSRCFAFHWDLKKHMRKHTGNKPFKCSLCPKSFNSQEERRNHNWLHTGKKEYKCQVCHHEFISISNLNAHMRKHTGEKPYKCEYCPKSFHMLGHYQCHMRRHTGEKPYKCEICGKALSSSKNLTEHRNVHTGERPYSCSQCDRRFTHRSGFKQHMLMHEGNKPYKCHICSKAFVQSSNYHTHIETHKKKEDRVQKCDLCGKELLSRRGMQDHRLRCVKKTVETANAHLRVLRTSRLRRGEYRCELCPRVFSYSRRLEAHVASKHPRSQEDSTMKPRVESTFEPFAAENAGSSNDVSSGKNSRSKRGEFPCEHCPKIFVYSRRLQSHVKKYHASSTNDSTDTAKIHPPSSLRFQCSACGRWFRHKKRLREHQIKNHQQGLLQESASTAVPQTSVPLLPKSSDSDKNVPREGRDLTKHPLEAIPRVFQADISPANSQTANGETTKNYLHRDDKEKREAGETGFESLSALSRLFAHIGMEGSTSSQSITEVGQISQ